MEPPRELRVGKLGFPLCARADGRWVSWWKNGTKRNLVSAVSLPRLRQKMELVAIGILNGNLDAAQLDAGDHRAYVAYGIAVDLAAREYAAARAGERPCSSGLDKAAPQQGMAVDGETHGKQVISCEDAS